MKTRAILFIFSLFILIGCNLNFRFEELQDAVFDVCYINQVEKNLLLVSYKSGIVQDRITIKKGKRKLYNNVRSQKGYDGLVGAPFIKTPDSVLIIQDFEINSDTKKYKSYIKQGCEGWATKPGCFESGVDNIVFFYGIKSENSVERKWYSLNKGSFYYQYIFNDAFFDVSLKMYDYEKRGL